MSQQPSKPVTGAIDDRQKIDKLREKISEYIRCKEKKDINDSKTICLLRRVFVACSKNIIIDVTFTLHSVLTVMNKRLSRIEEKEMSKTDRNSSYAEAAVFERTSSASWAQVASTSKITLKKTLRENREARKLMISIIDDKNKKMLKQTTIKNLAKTLRIKCDVVTSINRLQSDDIRVFTRSQKIKETLQKNTEWITMIVEFATVKHRIFDVLVHEVRVKIINMTNQEKTIDNLQNVNAVLHESLIIKKISWSYKIIKENRLFSSLRMKIEIVEMTNKLMNEDMLIDYELRYCERQTRDSCMTQCFNCQKYDHIDKFCKQSTRCDRCAKSHSTQKCQNADVNALAKCATCDEKHIV